MGNIDPPIIVGRALLEREDELAQIGDALERVPQGTARPVVVAGGPGVGKTCLLRSAHELARSLGLMVLSARGSEVEREFEFEIVRQLLGPAIRERDSAGVERLFLGAATRAREVLGFDAGVSAEGSEAATLHGLYWVVVNLSLEAPVLLMFDDLHWSDRASYGWIRYLLRRLEGLRVGVVLAMRSVEPGAETLSLEEMPLAAEPIVLRPAALSEAATATLVRQRMGREPASEFSRACRRVTGGNPFLLEEVIRELTASAVEPTEEAAARLDGIGPATIARAVLLRLQRIGPDAVALAHAIAVLGPSATLARACAVAGIERSRAEHAADAMLASGILAALRPLEYIHPVVGTAVLEELSPAARSRAHRLVARRLLDEGQPVTEAAAHLLASEPCDEQWSVDALREAGKHALAIGFPAGSARYLRRALSEPPAAPERGGVLLELGRAEAHAGEPGGIGHLEQALELANSPAERARVVLELGFSLSIIGRPREAIALASESLVRLPGSDRELRARLAGLVFVAALTTVTPPGELDRWVPDLINGANAESKNGRIALARVACYQGLRLTQPIERIVDDLLRARIDELPWTVESRSAIYYALLALIAADRLSDAEAIMRRIERSETARGLPLAAGQIAACRGIAAYQAGALADAEAELRGAIELASELGGPVIKVEALARLMMTLTELGQAEQARLELRASGFPEEMIANMPRLRIARGVVNFTLGDPSAAQDDFRGAGELLQAGANDNPFFISWRLFSAQALAALGHRAEAARLAADELEIANRVGLPRAIGMALRTAGQLAGGEHGIALLRSSLAALERAPAMLERARTSIELGAALRRANQRAEARILLRAGLEEAAIRNARPLIDRARDELLATGARPRRVRQTGVDALTASERRVVRLASEGLSNPEIAQRLFVTINTVEGHLRHVYHKLSINSRQQLPRAPWSARPDAIALVAPHRLE